MRYWILLIPVLSFADVNTTGNLISNSGFDNGTDNWTLSGDAQRIGDCCPGGHDLEFGPSGSIEQSFNLISNSITQPMLDNGITLNSSVEVQNGECGVAQCWGGSGPADSFTIRLQIRDEDDEVLATTTQERFNVTGINGKDFTNSVTHTGVGSNIGNILISGSDSNNRRLGGPNVDNISVTMTYDDTVLSLEQTQILTFAFEEIEEVTAEIELVEIEPLAEIVFEIFEEPEIEITMIEEIALEEIAIQEISTGVVNVFTEIPMEVSYGGQENIEEIATEIQIEEEFVEATEELSIETSEVTTSPGEELVGGNESEGGESETGVPGESEVAGGEQSNEQVVEETETNPEPTETETLVASEEVEDETVGETETSESNEGDETTEVADASGENDQGTSEAIEEGGSSETSARNDTTVSIENIEKKVNETLKRVDQRLIATSIIAAKAMQSKVSVESYGNTNSEIFDTQPQIDGGNYYETRQYIDARNLYAQNQNVYDDAVTQYQENVQSKVDERIRAEEHLRRIRGY